MEMKKTSKKAWWYPAIKMFMRVSGWIVGPIIAALIIGNSLDNYYNTEHWFFAGFTLLAFMISMFILVKEISFQMKKIKDIGDSNEDLK